MNPNAQQYRVRPCIVCGFPFSDEHHIHPEVLGRDKSPTVSLCPNHHRLAHIIQSMVINSYSEETILEFADSTFDLSFNKIALPILFSTYKQLAQSFEAQSNIKLQKGDAVLVCIDCDYVTEKHNYMWGIVQAKELLSSIVYIASRNRTLKFKNQELKVINPELNKEFQSMSNRITCLVKEDLEEVELAIIECIQKQLIFTDRQKMLMAYMESDHYF